jgi:tRNA pseudouridine55 synthase
MKQVKKTAKPQISPEGNIFLVDKPLDFTSTDIVNIFKKNLNIKKMGHAGTLDPKATGLLILCSNKLTKSISTYVDREKEYSGIFKIGVSTKSYDTESPEENFKKISHITDEQIEQVRQSFLGITLQTPPMYSAVKYKGKPLYKLARAGKTVDREPKEINIFSFCVTRIRPNELFINVVCSKGTYIRVLAHDFGAKLGVGAYLAELRRIRIGEYTIENLDNSLKKIPYHIL